MEENEESFSLRVIAADRIFYEGRAKNLIITTLDGKLSFLAQHLEMIAALSPGELDIQKEDGSWIRVLAGFGSMMFAHNRAVVLADTCETQEELDARRAAEALERAKERMRQKQSMQEYKSTQAAMARALSRLKFKGKQLK